MSFSGKTLEELNLIDDFMINAVVSNREVGEAFCRRALSVLLQRNIGKLSIIAQRTVPALAPGLRGIRMDVEINEYADKDDVSVHNVYDLEPHLKNNIDLPRHNRFYQAKIDSRYMESGEKNFSKLPNLYVITITNYDPFGQDYMMYTVNNRFNEVLDLEYKDGLQFIYFYTKGHKGGNKDIQAMLQYFQNSTEDNVVDEATREIHDYISRVKIMPEVRDAYMRFEELMEYAKIKGRELGREESLRIFEKLIHSGKLAIEDVAAEMNITVAELEQRLGIIKETV